MNTPRSDHQNSRSAWVGFIYRFPKGTIWQTRYICLPTVIALNSHAFSTLSAPLWSAILSFTCGMTLWTLMEYLLHRFVLHYDAKSEAGRALIDRLHVFHHHDPKDQTQVCIPPALLLVFGLTIYSGLVAIPGLAPVVPKFVTLGLMTLMVIYDITHFSTHYMPATNRILVALKKHHLQHHFGDPNTRFGVTSPFWDFVFGTLGPK